MKFTGSEQAVRFAYNMSQRVIASSPDYTKVGRATSTEGLGPHELHAQGALIMQALERMPVNERNALKAFLAPSPQWMKPLAELTEAIWPHLREYIPTQGIAFDSLVVWLRKEGKSVRTLLKDHGVSYRQANKWQQAAGTKFAPIYIRGVGLLDDELFLRGGLEKK